MQFRRFLGSATTDFPYLVNGQVDREIMEVIHGCLPVWLQGKRGIAAIVREARARGTGATTRRRFIQ
jgi:hypothetical protein